MEEWLADSICPIWADRLLGQASRADGLLDIHAAQHGLSGTEKRFLSLLQDHAVSKAATLSGLGRKRAGRLLERLRGRLLGDLRVSPKKRDNFPTSIRM